MIFLVLFSLERITGGLVVLRSLRRATASGESFMHRSLPRAPPPGAGHRLDQETSRMDKSLAGNEAGRLLPENDSE